MVPIQIAQSIGREVETSLGVGAVTTAGALLRLEQGRFSLSSGARAAGADERRDERGNKESMRSYSDGCDARAKS